eukprot:1158712-Pelagomonas_calceolata.AAC.1
MEQWFRSCSLKSSMSGRTRDSFQETHALVKLPQLNQQPHQGLGGVMVQTIFAEPMNQRPHQGLLLPLPLQQPQI